VAIRTVSFAIVLRNSADLAASSMIVAEGVWDLADMPPLVFHLFS
jgi:hypothetical protein